MLSRQNSPTSLITRRSLRCAIALVLGGQLMCAKGEEPKPRENPSAVEFPEILGKDVVPLVDIKSDEFGEHVGTIDRLAFDPSAKTLAVASKYSKRDDGGVSLFDVRSGKKKAGFFGARSQWVYSLAFSPKGDVLAASDHEGGLKLWDVINGRKIEDLIGIKPDEIDLLKDEKNSSGHLRFDRDGHTLYLLSGRERPVRRWDISTRMELAAWSLPAKATAVDIGLNPDRIFAWLSESGGPGVSREEMTWLFLWNVAEKKEIWRYSKLIAVDAWISVSPDGRRVTVRDVSHDEKLTPESTLNILDGASGRLLGTFVSPDPIHFVDMSPSGRYVATQSCVERTENGRRVTVCRIRIVDVDRASLVFTIQPKLINSGLGPIAFSHDDKLIALRTGPDSEVQIWDFEKLRERARMKP